MNLRKNDKKKRGFTLIEMVIVVVIIGILSSMALIKYDKVQQDAKVKTDCATASTIATAATMAYSNNKDDRESIDMEYLVDNGYLQSDTKCNTTNSNFDIAISTDGGITVTSDESIFYPKLDLKESSEGGSDDKDEEDDKTGQGSF